MRERTDVSLWELYQQGEWICLPISGYVKQSSLECVIPPEVRQYCPGLPAALGRRIFSAGAPLAGPRRPGEAWPQYAHRLCHQGNRVYAWPQWRVVTFPIRHFWQGRSDVSLVRRSARELQTWLDRNQEVQRIYMRRLGWDDGRLIWGHVRPMLASVLDDRVIVVPA